MPTRRWRRRTVRERDRPLQEDQWRHRLYCFAPENREGADPVTAALRHFEGAKHTPVAVLQLSEGFVMKKEDTPNLRRTSFVMYDTWPRRRHVWVVMDPAEFKAGNFERQVCFDG